MSSRSVAAVVAVAPSSSPSAFAGNRKPVISSLSMSSSDEDEYSPSLADRLATACASGDLRSASASIADGASVNEKGRAPGWLGTVLPLEAAAYRKHRDVLVWLLSHGADPNGDRVMNYGAYWSTAGILQLLIDAGGVVSRESVGRPSLGCVDIVQVLLAQPSLDFAVQYDGKTAEQYARDIGKPALADMIAREVSGMSVRSGVSNNGLTILVALLWLTDRETSDAGTATDCLSQSWMRCGAVLTRLAVAVVSWQSAEQRCREMEASDAASVARLVRGVRSLHVVVAFVSMFCMMFCMLW